MEAMRMTHAAAALGAAALGVALAGCGAGAATPAGPGPSESARMVCAAEAQLDIAQTLGEHTSKPVTPTWSDHLYACTYSYPEGAIGLSVKELPDGPATDAWFDGLASRLGRRTDPLGLGQGSFVTANESVVVRKDNRVLLVDVHGLPAEFGHPPIRRLDVAEVVAETIMRCWTGA
jgi:hypothetical protein